MQSNNPQVALVLSEEEVEYLLTLLLTTEHSELADHLLYRVAEARRRLSRSKAECIPGPPGSVSRAA